MTVQFIFNMQWTFCLQWYRLHWSHVYPQSAVSPEESWGRDLRKRHRQLQETQACKSLKTILIFIICDKQRLIPYLCKDIFSWFIWLHVFWVYTYLNLHSIRCDILIFIILLKWRYRYSFYDSRGFQCFGCISSYFIYTAVRWGSAGNQL